MGPRDLELGGVQDGVEMNVQELIEQLQNPHCPKDAKVVACFSPDDFVVGQDYPSPQVIWWSDDRKTVYMGEL